MKRNFLAVLMLGLLAANAQADSNGTISITGSETQSLGAGPFNHNDAAGDPDNSIASATFTSGINANVITISGDITANPASAFAGQFFLNEADIFVTPDPLSGGTSFTWQNPTGAVPDTSTGPIPYSSGQSFGPATATGTWNFEFIDTFDDVAGSDPDSTSANVSVTLSEQVITDSSGVFGLGSVGAAITSAVSEGEFLVGDIFDQYSLNVTDPGVFSFITDEDPLGVSMGDLVDTEIGLFDSSGLLIAYDDDDGNGTFSDISDLSLIAGDYTLVVSGFGSNISDAGVGTLQLDDVTGGNAFDFTGDYSLQVSFEPSAVPEPSSLAVMSLVGLAFFSRRRRS